MSQRPENFNPADEDPEATLVAPRFDAADAQRAHPVVPLAEAPTRARRERAPRRSWMPALLAVALLAVAALGGAVVTMVIQGSRAERVREAEQVPEQTPAAPARAAEEAPPPPQPSTPAAAKVEPGEEASAKPVSRDTQKPASRDTQTRRTRANAPAPVAVKPPREDADEDEREDRRGRSSGRRREREDEVEKELRKALRRGKGKAPRLVDVLTASP